jgi:hypothetical protein
MFFYHSFFWARCKTYHCKTSASSSKWHFGWILEIARSSSIEFINEHSAYSAILLQGQYCSITSKMLKHTKNKKSRKPTILVSKRRTFAISTPVNEVPQQMNYDATRTKNLFTDITDLRL